MTGIPVYIILPDKTGELHSEPLKTEQNTSRRMEVLSPKKFSLCTSKVLLIPLSKCPWRNQNRTSPKELEQNVPKGTRIECARRNQNLGAGPPHPIHQYSSGNIDILHIHVHTYLESFFEHIVRAFRKSHNQKFHRITLSEISQNHIVI